MFYVVEETLILKVKILDFKKYKIVFMNIQLKEILQ